LGYCGWLGDGLATIGEVEEFFGRLCWEADKALGEPAGIRWLTNWYDETDRPEMIRELLPEVVRSIAMRKSTETSNEREVI
jgi:hypothetical protein